MGNNILYSFRRCPYAMRARWSLLSCNIKVLIREVDLKRKPSELLKVSPKGTVPVLINSSGNIIEESLDIMKWSISNSNNDFLTVSQDLNADSDCYRLIKENDSKFKYHLDRYKYKNRFKESMDLDHHSAAREILLKWNKIIKDSSGKDKSHGWLTGSQQGLADWAIWPFVRQFSKVDIIKFENDNEISSLRSWLKYFTSHFLFKALMYKYKTWQPSDSEIIYP